MVEHLPSKCKALNRNSGGREGGREGGRRKEGRKSKNDKHIHLQKAHMKPTSP
jgi:hypothetical protein